MKAYSAREDGVCGEVPEPFSSRRHPVVKLDPSGPGSAFLGPELGAARRLLPHHATDAPISLEGWMGGGSEARIRRSRSTKRDPSTADYGGTASGRPVPTADEIAGWMESLGGGGKDSLGPPRDWIWQHASGSLGTCPTSFRGGAWCEAEVRESAPISPAAIPLAYAYFDASYTGSIATLDDDIDTFAYSFSYLLFNLDLAAWAQCWLTGEDDLDDCIFRTIATALTSPIPVVFRPDLAGMPRLGDATMAVMTASGGKQLWVNTRSDNWEAARSVISRIGDRAGPDDACVASYMAAVILHELTHYCDVEGEDEPGECDHSYLLQSNFLYALARRYSLAESDCCRLAAEDSVFGLDKTVNLTCKPV